MNPEGSLQTSQGRGLLELFYTVPVKKHTTGSPNESHPADCGFIFDATSDKETRLVEWMTEAGASVQLASDAHIAYMKQQRAKLQPQLPYTSKMYWL